MKLAINGVIDEVVSKSFSESIEDLKKMEEKLNELRDLYKEALDHPATPETLAMIRDAIDVCEKRYHENVKLSEATFELLLKSGFVIVE